MYNGKITFKLTYSQRYLEAYKINPQPQHILEAFFSTLNFVVNNWAVKISAKLLIENFEDFCQMLGSIRHWLQKKHFSDSLCAHMSEYTHMGAYTCVCTTNKMMLIKGDVHCW